MPTLERSETRKRYALQVMGAAYILIVAGLAIAAPVRADSGSVSLGTNTLTMAGPPVVGGYGDYPTITLTYMNNAPVAVTGNVYFNIVDPLGNTVYATNSTALTWGSGQSSMVIVVLQLPAQGLYTVTFFVVADGGIVVSPTNSTVFG
jgi:ABC-type Co2+ transport system permease subunit